MHKYLVIQFYSIICILSLKTETENEKASMTKKRYFFPHIAPVDFLESLGLIYTLAP